MLICAAAEGCFVESLAAYSLVTYLLQVRRWFGYRGIILNSIHCVLISSLSGIDFEFTLGLLICMLMSFGGCST
jgi:hypothetical protein